MTWGISAGNERGMTETALRPAPGQQKRGAGRDLGGPQRPRGGLQLFSKCSGKPQGSFLRERERENAEEGCWSR